MFQPPDLTNARVNLPAEVEFPEGAFVMDGKLVILASLNRERDKSLVRCLEYVETPTGFALVDDTPLPWAISIFDVDATTGDIIGHGRAQKFAGYYRYNVRTKSLALLGFVPSDYVLFLQKGVVRTLKREL